MDQQKLSALGVSALSIAAVLAVPQPLQAGLGSRQRYAASWRITVSIGTKANGIASTGRWRMPWSKR